MFLKIKSLWQKIRNPLNNMWAITVLVIGIAIMLAGVAGFFLLKFIPVLPIFITAICGFIGGLIADGGLRRLDFKNDVNGKLEKELEEEQRKNRELNEALKKAEKDKAELQHRLDTTANITRIQPVMKLIVGEISFDTVDYYEKRLDNDERYKHLFSRKIHEDPEYYRGVYKYSGQAEMRIDFAKIKVAETADAITICGPLEYEQKIIKDEKESRWLMFGRREQESRHGKTEDKLETYEIKVNAVRDRDLEDEQLKVLNENLDKLKIIDSMKTSSDRLVFEFVKMMLAPTGKQITYDPTAAGSIPTRTLGELVADYNRRAALPGSQNVMNGYLENH